MSEDDRSFVEEDSTQSAPTPAAYLKQSTSEHGRIGAVASRSDLTELDHEMSRSFPDKRQDADLARDKPPHDVSSATTTITASASKVQEPVDSSKAISSPKSEERLEDSRRGRSPTATHKEALDNESVQLGEADAASIPQAQPSSLVVLTNSLRSQQCRLSRNNADEDQWERNMLRQGSGSSPTRWTSATHRAKDKPEAIKEENMWDGDGDKGDDGKRGDGHGDDNLEVRENEETKGMGASRFAEDDGGALRGLFPLFTENGAAAPAVQIPPGSKLAKEADDFVVVPSQKDGREFTKTEAGLEQQHPSGPQNVSAGPVPRHSASNIELSSTPTRKISLAPPISMSPDETSTGHEEDQEGHGRQTVIEMRQLEESKELGDIENEESSDLRQHSSSNLVSLRRCFTARQSSLELFEEEESDTSSNGSDFRESEKIAELPAKPTITNPLKLNFSKDGISGMAAAAKATVRRNSITSKYLKLFAPINSAHETHRILATIHRQMNGTGWPRRGGWDSYLVRKSRSELDNGRVYGVKSKEGSVEVLVLSSNNVCGRIPPEIARLSSLKYVNLSDNHISGPIPAELGLLLQLETLQLEGNNLRDEISPLLGSIIKLVRLCLGHNKLSGPIPDSLGNLVHLKYLSMEHNHLTGNIPSFICHLPELEFFNVSSNQLDGAIPEAIGSLRMLKKLDLSENLLEGTIPNSLWTLKVLNWLRLDCNQLEGKVPTQFSRPSHLLILNLNFNKLSGPISAVLGRFPDIINALLRGNSFHGPYPFPVAQGSSHGSGLRKLDLGCNNIEEPLPDLTGLRDLQTLAMDNNRFYGELGKGLTSACPELFKLHLQNNRLTGEIPDSLGTLSKLEDLDLSNNCFEGYLPPGLQSLQLLETFLASNNVLSGELLPFLGSLTALKRLALDGNKFEGTIPRELGKLTSLEGLYLERNELVGSIPAQLSMCVSLRELFLHENKLWGNIPDSLRGLVELRYLYLYRNRLTGTIPEWLAELQHLQGLVLGENRLRGTIPWQLGHLHKLRDLYLNDNNLEGGIPERLVVNCERLQRLVVAGNRLTGRVSRSFAGVQDLRELNIERNNMHGELPIPLFLKPGLGPNACGLKFDGNPRIIDSRAHFASTVAGIRRLEAESTLSAATSRQRDVSRRPKALVFAVRSIVRAMPARSTLQRKGRPSVSGGSRWMSAREASSAGPSHVGGAISMGNTDDIEQCKGRKSVLQQGPGTLTLPYSGPLSSSATRRSAKLEPCHGETVGRKIRLSGDDLGSERDIEEGCEDDSMFTTRGDDRGGLARPWVSSEDVFYFLLKVVVGNALMVLDFVVAVRLWQTGCVWGAVFILVWKAMAALEGVTATRRLGYGKWWQSFAAVGLALPLESRRCFYHSCESDLFQALQQVEWRWHAIMQLVTQLAACLGCWGYALPDLMYVWVSVAMKGLVVGVVSMQRLDDKRLLRAWKDIAVPQPASVVNLTWASKLRAEVVPWFQTSAWPRLILVGFHVAELSERTIPLAVLVAGLGYWAFLVPLAMVPGMFVRLVVRWGRCVLGGGGVSSEIKKALGVSLALDSAFGAGTPAHFVALIATTMETVVFISFAAGKPRAYPSTLGDAILSWCSAMLIYTWFVFFLEKFVPLEEGPPRMSPSPLLSPSTPHTSVNLAKASPSNVAQVTRVVDSVDRGENKPPVGWGSRTGLVVPTEGAKG